MLVSTRLDAFQKPVNRAHCRKARKLPEKRVIVVGAGMGGLAAALTLSSRASVTVLERAAKPGGKMRSMVIDGEPIDIGPTVLTMKWVFDELFAAAGLEFDSLVTTRRLDVLARHGWRDGSMFDLLADERAATDAVGRFAGAAEAKGFARFTADSARIFTTLRDSFLRAPAPDMARLIAGAGPFRLLKLDPFTSYWQALGRYFNDARLKQLFARYATYCGASPFKAPATLMLIAHVERVGVWVADGGMAGLARTIADCAASKGAVFHFGQHVAEVLVENGRVVGVMTAAGERFDADAVIVNADAAAIASGALGSAAASAAPGGANRARSQSALTFALAAVPSGFALDRHNVFFSNDYRAEFDSVFERREIPAQPTTYVWAPTRGRLFCLVNAPANGGSHTYSAQEIDVCRRRMLDHLQACGLTMAVKISMAMTPADFARDYPGTDGALYGAPSHGWQATFQRPGVKTRVPGLYLAGGSVHPGPGVPVAALSGLAAAKCLMSDFGLT